MKERGFIQIVDPEENSSAIVLFGVLSVVFHLFLLFIVPLMLMLFNTPGELARPATVELLDISFRDVVAESKPASKPPVDEKIPEPPAPEPEPVSEPLPEPKPAPVVKPEPKPTPREQPRQRPQQPAPQPVKEDLSDLDDLFAAVPKSRVVYSSDFTFDYYKSAVQRRVERFWNPSVRDPNMRVVLHFSILRSGAISGLRVAESSGNSRVDQQALVAVTNASPFDPLPQGYSGRQLDLVYTLIPSN